MRLPRSPADLFDLTGRRALVTGGAMSIGREVALTLAAAGADVAIQTAVSLDEAAGLGAAAREVVDEIRRLGRSGCVIDAVFGADVEGGSVVREAAAALGGVDILVICASVQARTGILSVSREEAGLQFEVNLRTTVGLLQTAVPPMLATGWGRVLSIGSINQVRPEPELAIYAALKAAQHSLITNLAREHAASGVTFNTLSPGLIATERNRWRRKDAAAWSAIQARANPMGRAGAPQEVAGAALLLCSDAGAFITGVDLQAGGGAHL